MSKFSVERKKICNLETSMGCKRLTYHETLSPLKVVCSDLNVSGISCVGSYRYGFNGMEKDDKIKGQGNSYTTEFRQYDPRVGRWLSLDPLMSKYPGMSPYVAFNDNPLRFVDPDGREGQDWVKGGENGKNEWRWNSSINSAKEAKAAGYDDYSDGISNNSYQSNIEGKKVTVTLKPDATWGFSYNEEQEPEVNIKNWDSGITSKQISAILNSPITNLNPGSDGYKFSDPQGVRNAWGSKDGWEAVILSAEVTAVASVALPSVFMSGPSLTSSKFFGVATDLSAKTIATKMGVSVGTQAVFNNGNVSIFGTTLDGVLAPGSSSLIGNLWSPTINVTSGAYENNYLGNGISADQYLFRTATGMAFGAKQNGLDAVSGAKARPFTQFSSGMGSQGINKVYDVKR